MSSATAATVVRIGCVSYLNTLPLIEGLGKHADLRLTLTAPARLIDLLLAREIDVGLVSLIDYQRSPEPLALIPAGMIGCDGPTMTVRLFSKRPAAEIDEVHADADSHTSIALLRIVLATRHGVRPRIVEFDVDAHRAAGEGPDRWPDALLLIGDKVVTDSPPAALYPHQLDLGEAWHQMTGLPFVYALWMCHEADAGSEAVALAAAALDRQRRRNAMRLDWITAARAPVRGWPADLAHQYLRGLLRFEVTPGARRAVERFFDLSLETGLIAQRRPTRWLES